MKRIIFTNPPKDLFSQLKQIGLIDFHTKDDPKPELKGKSIWQNKIEGISENAIWGDYTEFGKYRDKADFIGYNKKYLNKNLDRWKSATIDLSDKGIEILTNSGIKGWKVMI